MFGIPSWLTYSTLGGGVTLLTVFFLLIKYPDNVQKWVGMILRLAGFLFNRLEYISTQYEIEGKLNSFSSNLETSTGHATTFARLSIKWTARDEKEDIVFEDGQTIILIRDRKHRNKNFVHAAYFYTSKILLGKAKRQLTKVNSKHIKTAVDLFVTKKIIEQQNIHALDQFVSDYLVPESQKSEEVKKYIEQFARIDRAGIFFPVLIQELQYLGNKLFASINQEELVKEIKNFAQFLEKRAEREVGDSHTQEAFNGKYMKCSVKVVATRHTRESGKVIPQKDRVIRSFKQGIENVYVIGSSDTESKDFIDRVVKNTIEEMDELQIVANKTFQSKIKVDSKWKKVKTYLVQIHNPSAVEHIEV